MSDLEEVQPAELDELALDHELDPELGDRHAFCTAQCLELTALQEGRGLLRRIPGGVERGRILGHCRERCQQQQGYKCVPHAGSPCKKDTLGCLHLHPAGRPGRP